MRVGNNELSLLLDLIDIAAACVMDKTLKKSLEQVRAAQQKVLEADRDARREKSSALISAMADLDISASQLTLDFFRLRPSLSAEACEKIDRVLRELLEQREQFHEEKRRLSHRHSATPNKTEQVNGIELLAGDVLAVSRKAGLYQHFAVYVGDRRVIHYAAERGDFNGKISIHEASLDEFRGNSTFVYVLDFPDNSGRPVRRGDPLSALTNSLSGKSLFLDLIRKTSYHLYTPEETVARARSRIGEERYALPFNNCEHFAIWCKTGVHESHQVNLWLSHITGLQWRFI